MMTGLAVVRSPSMIQRRQPLLSPAEKVLATRDGGNGQVKRGKKFGEVAGGTAAECAAVCCCCPCTVMNLLVLAVYRVPAGLCKKAWRKQRKRHRLARRKQVGGLLMGPTIGSSMEYGAQMEELLEAANAEENERALELEKEMWDQFSGTGFWRSPSQRDPIPILLTSTTTTPTPTSTIH